jgi:hypothetical protein
VRFTFKREAMIMTALLVSPVLLGLLMEFFRVLFPHR